MKALIVDDESKSRETLQGKLDLFCPEVEVIGEAEGVEQALAALRKHKPELLFLDIELAGESGFDILTALREDEQLNPAVIFITAHDEFAIKAIKFSALDYLLKPIDPEELVKAVRKAEEEQNEPKKDVNLDALAHNIRQGEDAPRKVVVSTSEGIHILDTARIIRLESSSNYCKIFQDGEKSVVASRTLKDFSGLLEGNTFLRIHKSHLINLHYMRRFVSTDGGYVIMSDESKLPVSNRKRRDLVQIIRNL